MSHSVTMPALGESVSEGTVTRWLKQEGDQVKADEPLLEVSTDKVDTEIPSPASGVLQKIVVAEDETVAVGAELAIIGDGAGEPAQDGGSDEQPAQQESAEQGAPARRRERVRPGRAGAGGARGRRAAAASSRRRRPRPPSSSPATSSPATSSRRRPGVRWRAVAAAARPSRCRRWARA